MRKIFGNRADGHPGRFARLLRAAVAAIGKSGSGRPEYSTTATIKDIMDSIVDPGADGIWGAVETVVSAKGVEEKQPHTDEEWKEVRRKAIMLLEATNLLQMPGRHVAKPGEKADDPKVELASRADRRHDQQGSGRNG